MNFYNVFPINYLVRGAYWLVNTLSSALEPLVGAQSAAIAIIVLTLCVRALLIPVGRSQAKAQRTRLRLAPKLAELQRKHGKSPELLQRKTAELYAKEQASPFAGCLPVLAQAPVLMAVYGIFIQPTIGGKPNALLSHTFFGVPLDASLFGLIGTGSLTPASATVGIAIMVLIAAVTFASRKWLTPAPQPTSPATGARGGSAPQSSAGAPALPDLTALTRALGFLPFVTVVFAGVVPFAAALYLATSTTWTFVERLVLGRIYGTLGAAKRTES